MLPVCLETRLKPPSSAPSEYRTKAGLLNAFERVCRLSPARVAGQSRAMWIQNAFHACEAFGPDVRAELEAIRDEYAPTRVDDLTPIGSSLPGAGKPPPPRPYGIGDVVPGCGKITDLVKLADGARQFCIRGEWFHERVFADIEQQAA